MKYHSYNLSNLHEIKQLKKLNKELIFNINVVGSVLPFKVNNHVVENLINWNNPLDDPMFHLTFPVKEMLSTEHFEKIADLIKIKADYKSIKRKADKIRESLNPNPAGQQNKNIPVIDGTKFRGIQHKYRETVLFFPSRGQTCHAYCSFCFRWPQFTGIRKYKFSDNQIDRLIHYLQLHPRVTDILITGGDPLTMSTKFLTTFINKLLKMDHPGLQNIRIGTKTLSYWPYRYVTDHDADALLQLFENVNNSGKRIALMAHFNHYRELEPPIVETAVKRILNTGTTIRTQAPLLNHINNSSDIWIKMWNLQVKMGMIPYYFFIARNTGAQKYFAVPLVNAYEIYKSAYTSVSGLARTVRGPVMSCDPGKIQILGLDTINNEDVFVLRFIQGRDNNWVKRIFYAQKNENAIWRDQLKPAFGKARFFMMNKIGLLGGSFNPIHIGHLTIAEIAREQLNLQEIWFLPTGNHPFKPNNQLLDIKLRIKLIESAISNNKYFKLSLLDSSSSKNNYTSDLIRKLHLLYPNNEFYFIVGSDIILELHKWHEYDWLLENINFVVFPRPGFPFSLDRFPNFTLLDISPVEISSSEIRNRIENNLDIKNLVPDVIRNKVLKYYRL